MTASPFRPPQDDRRRSFRLTSRRLGGTVGITLLLVLAAAACTSSKQGLPVPTRAAPTGSSPAAQCPSEAVKQPLAHLIVSDGTAPAAGQAISVNVSWADLQPTADGPLKRPNAIDDALTRISASSTPCTGLRLRVLAGTSAPQWAKQLGGAPVSVDLQYDGKSGTIGRFWTPEFGAAYDRLQQLLAQAYDNEPQVREVAVSRCTTFYAEPMVRQLSDPGTVSALMSAGYTTAADLTCQREQLTAAQVWKHTNVYLAMNPYDTIDSNGRTSQSVSDSIDIARQCRDLFGSRCVLGNNSVRVPTLGGAYPELYNQMRTLGDPFSFQLAAPGRIGDVSQAIAWCIQFGASSVELTSGTARQLVAALATAQPGVQPAQTTQITQWLQQ